jgi:hypothetical protein
VSCNCARVQWHVQGPRSSVVDTLNVSHLDAILYSINVAPLYSLDIVLNYLSSFYPSFLGDMFYVLA